MSSSEAADRSAATSDAAGGLPGGKRTFAAAVARTKAATSAPITIAQRLTERARRGGGAGEREREREIERER